MKAILLLGTRRASPTEGGPGGIPATAVPHATRSPDIGIRDMDAGNAAVRGAHGVRPKVRGENYRDVSLAPVVSLGHEVYLAICAPRRAPAIVAGDGACTRRPDGARWAGRVRARPRGGGGKRPGARAMGLSGGGACPTWPRCACAAGRKSREWKRRITQRSWRGPLIHQLGGTGDASVGRFAGRMPDGSRRIATRDARRGSRSSPPCLSTWRCRRRSRPM